MEKSEKKEKKEKNEFVAYIKIFIEALIIAFLIRHFIFSSNVVSGESMNPTFENKDRLISLILPLRFKDPNHGDIIIFDSPIDKDEQYIKRVIGVPHDNVKIIDGNVYINDIIIEEPYIEKGVKTEISNGNEWNLQENEFFVMGDNRLPNKSLDSRSLGPINKDSIRGIVRLRFWPIKSAKIFGGIDG